MTLPRPLSPYHRDTRDYLWFDFRPRLADGSLIVSATVAISTRASNQWEDRSAAFGPPAAEINPAPTTDEAGAAVGGAGWVRVGPLAPGDVPRGVYTVKVSATLSDSRVRTETANLEVTDTGDPTAP